MQKLQKPQALKMGDLMQVYDSCTLKYTNRKVGDESDTPINGEHCRYGFLQQYRTRFEHLKVKRVYLCSARHFSIVESDALSYLHKEQLAFVPLVEPDTSKRHLVTPRIANKVYLTMYSTLMYFLYHHLETFKNTKDETDAAMISFQDTGELDEIIGKFSRACSELAVFNRKCPHTPIRQVLLQELEKYRV